MPKKRVADIARERGLEPAEVARRLAEAGVKLSGDAVDEAAAARALGGSRPARSKVSAVAAAPDARSRADRTGRLVATLRSRRRPPRALLPGLRPLAPALRPRARGRPAAVASTAPVSARAAVRDRGPGRELPARCLRASPARSAAARPPAAVDAS